MNRGVVGIIGAAVVFVAIAMGTFVGMRARRDPGPDRSPPAASESAAEPAETVSDAVMALEGAEPGDRLAVEAFLATDEGAALGAIPEEPFAPDCDTIDARLGEDEFLGAATDVPDRWLNEAAIAVYAGASDVLAACDAGESEPSAGDLFDRAVDLYNTRLDQIGVGS